MPTQITNQASLVYNYGSATGNAVSNIATTTLLDPIAADKTSVGNTYRPEKTSRMFSLYKIMETLL